MATDAVTLIQEDHRLLEGLFGKLQAGEGDRRALVGEVVARLTAHARAEEREVYPAITRADPEEEPEVEHAYDEHKEAEHLLVKVRNLVGSDHFEQALAEFVEAVRHHVEEEEDEVLPALRDAVDEATLEELGAAFAKTRAEELRTAGLEEGAAGAETPAPDGLEHATRDELYEKAKEADIPGRSGMKKDELAEALREQD
ncbi:MAG TPA: hemerythrin domain-containing protein [Mycobacteriales bacterium]|jgi:hemerythrin superfamily protein|nr:hemerythrin domain-containing protein [Mycobacteriales bacterium]